MPPSTAARNAFGERLKPQAASAKASEDVDRGQRGPERDRRADGVGKKREQQGLSENGGPEDDARVVAEGHFLSPATVRKN